MPPGQFLVRVFVLGAVALVMIMWTVAWVRY